MNVTDFSYYKIHWCIQGLKYHLYSTSFSLTCICCANLFFVPKYVKNYAETCTIAQKPRLFLLNDLKMNHSEIVIICAAFSILTNYKLLINYFIQNINRFGRGGGAVGLSVRPASGRLDV